jgi:protein-disulfide isomerase/uncharacterized membrane protein
MMGFSALTIQHYFAANFPESVFQGSFCDISAFFNCTSSAFSVLSVIAGVPLGYFGLMLGGLVVLGALLPSAPLERTNRTLALLNVFGVVGLFLYSVIGTKTLCILCSGYYACSIGSLAVFWKRSGRDTAFVGRWLEPSLIHLAVFGAVTLTGAFGYNRYHAARVDAMAGGSAVRIVQQFYNLPTVPLPSFLSPYWVIRSTEQFEGAPIQVVEYGDLLCSDCLVLHEQLERLARDFKGQLNVVFQFFPLEAKCNSVVEKDKHPGACDASYLAAYDPAKFGVIHDEIFANFRKAKTAEWRAGLAKRHGVEAALLDTATRNLIQRIISTGAEYEKTSDRYAHGIRSTPTLIINHRMLIGTFPYEQMRAIFQALVDEKERGSRKFIENWVEP